MATFLKIVCCLNRYCIWLKDARCRNFLCNMFLPYCKGVRYEMGLCSCFKLSNAYLHIGNKHYLIKMKSDLFKKSLFLQRNATYWKGILILFLLSECYTFWMKVSVCKACTCQLELLLEKTYSCLIVFCGKIIYSVFTAFFQVWGKRPKVETLFM